MPKYWFSRIIQHMSTGQTWHKQMKVDHNFLIWTKSSGTNELLVPLMTFASVIQYFIVNSIAIPDYFMLHNFQISNAEYKLVIKMLKHFNNQTQQTSMDIEESKSAEKLKDRKIEQKTRKQMAKMGVFLPLSHTMDLKIFRKVIS